MRFTTIGFLYFITGLLALFGVVGGFETNDNLTVFQLIQLFVVALVGVASMMVGVSYLKDAE
jgi:uncharacterized membrane-anchored protein